MAISRRTFLASKMDKDLDERLLQDGQYRDALNIRLANSESSNVGAIEKSLSNLLVSELTIGDNVKTITSVSDEFEEKIYHLLKSDLGCYIVEYDVNTNATVFVAKDTRVGALNVLNFSEDYLITGINIVIDSDNGNRLLFFSDGNTQPKCVNIERGKQNYLASDFTEEMILVIKKPPLDAPSIVLGNTPDEENNIEEKFPSFLYRYRYLDGEFSAFSPLSEVGFLAKSFNYDYSTQSNESMVNTFNKVDITINTGGSLITDVQIAFKESGSNALYLIENYDKTEQGWITPNDFVSVSFTNNKIYKVLAEKELFRIYDNVPLKAKTQDIIDNMLVYGNYTENFDITDANGVKINIDLTAEKVSTAIASNAATTSLKSNRDYEVGIAYVDEYGRMTTPLTSEKNTIYIPNSDSISQNKIKVTLANKAPDFAKYYRFFIKQTKGDFETVIPTLFYQDGIYVWIKLEGGDKDKIHEGDYLYVKADSQEILNPIKQTKVLEIKEQVKNFLDVSVTDKTNQLQGNYFKIKPNGFRISEEDFTHYEFSGRTIFNTPSNANVIEKAVYYGTEGLDDLVQSGTYTGLDDVRYMVKIFSIPKFAKGTVTCASVLAGDTCTVNGLVYTAVAGVKADNTQFSIDTSDTACATDLANSITNDARVGTVGDQTATSALGVVTITTNVIGILGNAVTLVSSDATRLLTTGLGFFTDGKDDTFRWSNNDGVSWSDNGGLGYDITGAPQNIELGLIITFASKTGHNISDQWIVSAKSKDAPGYVVDDSNFLSNFYIMKSLESNGNINVDDIIYGGSRINIRIKEPNEGAIDIDEPFIASKKYANLEEWFYGDNIMAFLVTNDILPENVWFRRGYVSADGQTFTQNAIGDMCLIIKEYPRFASTWTALDIFYSPQNIIFETKPKDYNSDIFFEIGRTYGITDGNHLGYNVGDTNQSTGVSAILNLDVFNCYAWGNAYESYKIKDAFNAKTLNFDTRPSVPVENYRQNKKISAFTWSLPYEQTVNYNGLNEFNLSLINFKDLDDKYGAIQKMVSIDNNLDIWQEDKVVQVFFDKLLLYNLDGSSNLGKSDKLFDGVKYYAGEFGISKNPESLTVYGNNIYWVDQKRGVVLRKGQSGIEIISNFGMRSWFREIFKQNLGNILGGYDPYFGQYIISLGGYTLTFDEKVKGWTSFHSYLPDSIIRVNNRLFTVKDGNTYIHNETLNGYNEFYGQQFSSSVQTIFNDANFEDSIFKNIILESDFAWRIVFNTNYTNGTIPKSEFTKRESRYFASIKGNENESDLRGVTQGIGNIISANSNILTFANVTNLVSVGDKLYQVNGVDKELLGEITGINNNQITIDADVISPIINLFTYSKSNSRVNGVSIRGYYMNVTLIDDSNTANELYGCSTNFVKSYL